MLFLHNIKINTIAAIALSFAASTFATNPPNSNDAINALGSDTIEITPTISINDSMDLYQHDFMFDSLINDFYIQQNFRPDCSLLDTGAFVFYPDSVYISRLQSLPHIMEMTYNSIVKSYIEMYARRQKQVGMMLGIGKTYYFPLFEQSLDRYGVPLELCYLPVIESALNARATSHVGAAGLWQFMVGTGRIYGLEVNSLVDERRDPIKASDAAARYLADLYKLYGDWHLVIAAYNCGPGNVAKAIRHSGGKRNYWQIYPYLPRETRSYVPIFIAANYIMNFYKEHNICPTEPVRQLVTDTLMITDRVHLRQIADVAGLPLDQLQFLNPQYRYNIIPGDIKPYPLVLPLDNINIYAECRDTILHYMPELSTRQVKADPDGYSATGDVKYYKVKSGDTLGSIASRHSCTVKQLQKWNNLKGTTIRIGQRLRIYK